MSYANFFLIWTSMVYLIRRKKVSVPRNLTTSCNKVKFTFKMVGMAFDGGVLRDVIIFFFIHSLFLNNQADLKFDKSFELQSQKTWWMSKLKMNVFILSATLFFREALRFSNCLSNNNRKWCIFSLLTNVSKFVVVFKNKNFLKIFSTSHLILATWKVIEIQLILYF